MIPASFRLSILLLAALPSLAQRSDTKQPAYLKSDLTQLSPSEELILQRNELFNPKASQESREKATGIITELNEQLLAWDEHMEPYLQDVEQYEPLANLGESDRRADESQVESTKGLYFDTALSQLSYLGEVKLRDKRLHLDCHGLYVQLERESTSEHLKEEKEQIISKESEAPAEQSKKSGSSASLEYTGEPVIVTAQQALLDIDKECLFLRGDNAGITIRHSHGELIARGAKPLAIMSEALGAFYLLAEDIEGFYQNEDGSRSEIRAKGSLLFLLHDDSVYLQRDVHIKHQDQSFASAGTMRLALKPIKGQKAAQPPFASFQRQYEGLAHVVAEDEVALQIAGDIKAQQPATHIHADRFSYDAQTGAIILSGERSQLSQGKQELVAQGDSLIYWRDDGSISIQGDSISGQYERPIESEEQAESSAVMGEFKTSEELYFIASERAFYFPHGLRAEDEYSSLISTRNLYIPFLKKDEDHIHQHEPSEADSDAEFRFPPLVFAELGDPEGIYTNALLDVSNRAHPHFALRGSAMKLSFSAGLAEISADKGEKAIFDYGGRRLEALSEDKPSHIILDEQGDLRITATDITMQLPDDQGMQTLLSHHSLILEREQARILLGEDTLITSPDMKLHTQGQAILHLRKISDEELAKTNPQKGNDLLAQHPHLSYPFSGVDSAILNGGTSIQTAEFSLQNAGKLHITLADAEKKKTHPSMRGIAHLQAEDNVRLLMRSSDKRMLYGRGDTLTINGYTASKTLTGHVVYLSDEQSTHEARGNARLRLDAQNTATISGDKQITRAKNLREQLSTEKK